LVLDYRTNASGLTLTRANHVFLLDPAPPASEAQAVARAHRIGQIRSVHVYRLALQRTPDLRALAFREVLHARSVARGEKDPAAAAAATITGHASALHALHSASSTPARSGSIRDGQDAAEVLFGPRDAVLVNTGVDEVATTGEQIVWVQDALSIATGSRFDAL
jgi:hypothetical protein